LRIFAWNLNHRTHPKPIPAALVDGVLSLRPDVAIFTEYVSGPDQDSFCDKLRAAGLTLQFATPARKGYNQVLAAARAAGSPGILVPPENLPHGASNCLHLSLKVPRLELVGVRVPMYKTAKERRPYWDWFEAALRPLLRGPTVVIGDLNADPRRPGTVGPDHLRRLEAAGWQLPDPEGPWSYISVKGRPSRLDHALVSPGIAVTAAGYCPLANGYPFAGRGPQYFSDHAPLVLDVVLPGETDYAA
jgi:endonuclease/exonuclease/phosphatase family metal-dependent hydrolase